MRRRVALGICVVGAASVVSPPRSGDAQAGQEGRVGEAHGAKAPGTEPPRTLAGHVFTPSEVLIEPFADTSLGVAATARYEHTFGERTPLSRDDAILGAAAVDFDFRAISPVPIGLLASYQAAVPLNGDQAGHTLDGGVFYTGRPELVLGLETSVRRFPQGTSIGTRIDSDAIVGQLVTRYYW